MKCILRLSLLMMVFLPVSIVALYPGWSQLPHFSSPKCIAVDKNFIWYGTECGIVQIKYNGTVVGKYDKTNSKLPSIYINSILCDSESVWIATGKGLVRIEGDKWTVFDTTNTPFSQNYMYGLVKKENRLIAGTYNGGLYYFSNGKWEKLPGKNPSYLQDLAIDRKNRIWCRTEVGICHFEDTVLHYHRNLNALMSDYKEFLYMCIDSSDGAWVVTNQGLAHCQDTTWEMFTPKNSTIPSKTINDLCYYKNKLYICTSNRIGTFNPIDGWVQVDSVTGDYGSLSIEKIALDNNGDFWLGTYKKGLYKKEASGSVCIEEIRPHIYGHINDLIYADDGTLWIAVSDGVTTYKGGVWKNFVPFKSSENDISTLTKGKDGSIWCASSRHGLLARYKDTSAIIVSSPGKTVNILAADSNNILWIGTDNNGLIRLDNNGKFTVFDSANSRLQSNFISDIHIDNKGMLWVATPRGIVSFDGLTWQAFDSTNSILPAYGVRGICSDTKGNIWITTGYKGIIRYDKNNWRAFTPESCGIKANSMKYITITSNNEIWVNLEYQDDYSIMIKGLGRFDGKMWYNYTEYNSGLMDDDIYSLRAQNGKQVCIVTMKGITTIDSDIIKSSSGINKYPPLLKFNDDCTGFRKILSTGNSNEPFITNFDMLGREVPVGQIESQKNSNVNSSKILSPGIYIGVNGNKKTN